MSAQGPVQLQPLVYPQDQLQWNCSVVWGPVAPDQTCQGCLGISQLKMLELGFFDSLMLAETKNNSKKHMIIGPEIYAFTTVIYHVPVTI